MRRGEAFGVCEVGQTFPIRLDLAEAEAGVAQHVGCVLDECDGKGEYDGFLASVAQTGLAGEGATAECGPHHHFEGRRLEGRRYSQLG
jgi:hypothetical protein